MPDLHVTQADPQVLRQLSWFLGNYHWLEKELVYSTGHTSQEMKLWVAEMETLVQIAGL